MRQRRATCVECRHDARFSIMLNICGRPPITMWGDVEVPWRKARHRSTPVQRTTPIRVVWLDMNPFMGAITCYRECDKCMQKNYYSLKKSVKVEKYVPKHDWGGKRGENTKNMKNLAAWNKITGWQRRKTRAVYSLDNLLPYEDLNMLLSWMYTVMRQYIDRSLKSATVNKKSPI